jgi:N-acetylneuraminic acid mutarotase
MSAFFPVLRPRFLLVAGVIAMTSFSASRLATAQTTAPYEWTWMSGSSTVPGSNKGISGVYGTLQKPDTGNVPGSRQYAVSWIDGQGNLWLFGGEGYDSAGVLGYLNDLWEFNPKTKQWTWMSGSSTVPGDYQGQPGVYRTVLTPDTGNIPGGRFSSTSWTDAKGNLWLFGGVGFDASGDQGTLNDLWEFNTSTNEWAWMGGSTSRYPSGIYGTMGTAAAGNAPGSRDGAASWTDSAGNFWLFGGHGFDAKGYLSYLNDLWEFNTSTNEWAWMGGGSTSGSYGVELYESGVYGTLGAPATGNVPGGRCGAVSWTDSKGNLWLFGGEGYDSAGTYGFLNDLWEFNPTTNQWAWMSGSITVGEYSGQPGVYGSWMSPAAGNIPGGRGSAVSWIDSKNNLWLFGGVGYDSTGTSGYLNDLWEFQPSTGEWAWMGGSQTVPGFNLGQPGVYGTLLTPSMGNTPGSRGSAVSWSDSKGNFWLFGGDGFDSAGTYGYLNDLHQRPACSRHANLLAGRRNLYVNSNGDHLRHHPWGNHLLLHQRKHAADAVHRAD